MVMWFALEKTPMRDAVENPLHDDLGIIRRPGDAQALNAANDDRLTTQTGEIAFLVRDGVACTMPLPANDLAALPVDADGKIDVQTFYDTAGWTDNGEMCIDTKLFVDTRDHAMEYSRKCMRRLNRYFRKGGDYILDAGSGAIPHPELLDYDKAFRKRVCVDLSPRGLAVAKAKLGARGICLQGDLTKLPLADNSVDAVTCNHVIYQIPVDLQEKAFREIWRVLKPGGIAVVIYHWPYSPLEARLRKVTRVLTGYRAPEKTEQVDMPSICHEPQPLSWFRAIDWPFRYEVTAFRLLSNPFMRDNVGDTLRGRLFLQAAWIFQNLFPHFVGRHGAFPTILIHKD